MTRARALLVVLGVALVGLGLMPVVGWWRVCLGWGVLILLDVAVISLRDWRRRRPRHPDRPYA